MSKLTRSYSSKINSILKKILKEEEKKFLQCANLISKSYKKGGQLYIFGTGHSRLLGEESFHRAGGFAAACPIRDDDLSFKKGARKATALERTPNIAKKALAKYKITSKDILMIVSNSGVNHAPVEAALIAKKKKIKTISLTSVKYSKQAPLSKLNKRLFEITDIFIDNKIPPGDAIINIEGMQALGMSCIPDKPLTMVIYGAKNDTTVPPEDILASDGYFYEPMKNTVNDWKNAFNCSNSSKKQILT